jgi:hypothetical protein
MSANNQIFISARQVRQRYGNVSHMWIERRLAVDPEFPKPIYFGDRRYWEIVALESWERQAASRTMRATGARMAKKLAAAKAP